MRIECAPVVIVGSISHECLYTIRRLDTKCLITRVYDFELVPMHFAEKEAWKQSAANYKWSA